jgi:hypothetical protein
MLLPSVMSPIGDIHELSTNDDIFAGKDPIPGPLSSDFRMDHDGSDGLDVDEQ